MDGPDRMVRRKSLKERLGLSGIGCCGATWLPSTGEPFLVEDEVDHEDGVVVINMEPTTPDIGPTPGRLGMNLAAALEAEREFRDVEEWTDRVVGLRTSPSRGPIEPVKPTVRSTSLVECVNQTPGSSMMNLAAALLADRQFMETEESSMRAVGLSPSPIEGPSESSSIIPSSPRRVSLLKLLEETKEETKVVVGNDSMCCVCMIRKKGAAFIPCGHTFCRVCSRELWLNRGTCPLCNRSIIEILDIF